MGTAEKLQGYFAAARTLCGCFWSLQECSAVEHCRDTLRLGCAGILGGWALQGYSAVGRCRDTVQLGTAGILGGRAGSGRRTRTTLTIKSNNPTARVGNYTWKFPKTGLLLGSSP